MAEGMASSLAASFGVQEGGGVYFGRGKFWREIFVFQIHDEISPQKFLRNPGHFLLPASAANIFLLHGGPGARVLQVRISLHAGAYPKTP